MRGVHSRIARLEAHRGSGGALTVRWYGEHSPGRATAHAEAAIADLERRVRGSSASCAVWVGDGDHVAIAPLHGLAAGDVACWCGETHPLPV
jgi:hypothetical protein